MCRSPSYCSGSGLEERDNTITFPFCGIGPRSSMRVKRHIWTINFSHINTQHTSLKSVLPKVCSFSRFLGPQKCFTSYIRQKRVPKRNMYLLPKTPSPETPLNQCWVRCLLLFCVLYSFYARSWFKGFLLLHIMWEADSKLSPFICILTKLNNKEK